MNLTHALIACFLGATLYAVPAQAQTGSLVLVLEGRISGQVGLGLSTGPFIHTQANDAVRLTFFVETPGQVGVPESFFNIDQSRAIMEVGGVKIDDFSPGNSALLVGNDRAFPSFPQVDYIAGSVALGNIYSVDVLVEDAQGMIFNSADLTQELGVHPAPGNSNLMVRGTSLLDGIDVALDSLEIRTYGTVGTVYCSPPHPNSMGQPALMRGIGSEYVSAQSLGMWVNGLPFNSFALLLVGDQQSIILNPGGSQGDLCIAGGSIGRFRGQVAFSGFSGIAQFEVDLNALPQPNGTTVVLAGQTWNFQTIYRDYNPGPATNYTNPVAVTFQ